MGEARRWCDYSIAEKERVIDHVLNVIREKMMVATDVTYDNNVLERVQIRGGVHNNLLHTGSVTEEEVKFNFKYKGRLF